MRAMLLSIAVVMAATGCETTNTAYEMARDRTIERHKQPFKPRFQPGTDMLGHPPTPVAYQPLAPMVAPQAPQPVIVAGNRGSGVTMASQVGNTTIVSQFGGQRPYLAPPPPIIDTSSQPIYYTEAIQQP